MGRVKLGVQDDELLAAPDQGGLTTIPVDQIQPNPENPRPLNQDVRETAADLRDRGQLQNINVMTRLAFARQKPHLVDQLTDAPYVVVNGFLRWLAAPLAGLPGLKAEVRDEWTENDIDEAVVSENAKRVDVNPLLLGRHLARMLPRYGSHRKLAEALNTNQPWVSQRIGLTTLHPDLQAVILADGLPFKLTRECTRLHPDLQPLLASGELPEDVARAWLVDLRLKHDEQLARWQAGPPYVDESQPAGPAPADQDEPADEVPADRETKPRQQSMGIVIRLPDRSPTQLADALKRKYTAEEIAELIKALVG